MAVHGTEIATLLGGALNSVGLIIAPAAILINTTFCLQVFLRKQGLWLLYHSFGVEVFNSFSIMNK